MKEINVDLLEKMLAPQTSSTILMKSLDNLKPIKQDLKKIVIICLMSVVPAVLAGCSKDTVVIFRDSLEKINDVLLAIFGIIFTGYVFFQALINNELLVRMINDKVKKKDGEISKLQETNEEFVYLMMTCAVSIIFNLFLLLCFGAIPDDFAVLKNEVYNIIIAVILLCLYFSYIFYFMWEIKSFIFNIFQLFKLYAGTRLIEIINEENDKDK